MNYASESFLSLKIKDFWSVLRNNTLISLPTQETSLKNEVSQFMETTQNPEEILLLQKHLRDGPCLIHFHLWLQS